MRIGIPLFMLRPEQMAPVAGRAEALGFESVWVAEHLVFPVEIRSRYPYAAEGVPPINPGTPLFDPLLVLMEVAARSERIRLGTNVYILPLRPPIAVARMVATLDVLSRGRVSFGVGLGWLEEEFTAMGVDFATRGARTRAPVAWAPGPSGPTGRCAAGGRTATGSSATGARRKPIAPRPPIWRPISPSAGQIPPGADAMSPFRTRSR